MLERTERDHLFIEIHVPENMLELAEPGLDSSGNVTLRPKGLLSEAIAIWKNYLHGVRGPYAARSDIGSHRGPSSSKEDGTIRSHVRARRLDAQEFRVDLVHDAATIEGGLSNIRDSIEYRDALNLDPEAGSSAGTSKKRKGDFSKGIAQKIAKKMVDMQEHFGGDYLAYMGDDAEVEKRIEGDRAWGVHSCGCAAKGHQQGIGGGVRIYFCILIRFPPAIFSSTQLKCRMSSKRSGIMITTKLGAR